MRIITITRLATVMLACMAVSLAMILYWGLDKLNQSFVSTLNYSELHRQLAVDVRNTIQTYLNTGDATFHTQALADLDHLNQQVLPSLPASLVAQLQPVADALYSGLSNEFLGAGKLAGDEQGLLYQNERETVAALNQLESYALKVLEQKPQTAIAYLQATLRLTGLLSEIKTLRENFWSSGNASYVQQLEKTRERYKQALQQVNSLPRIGLYPEEQRNDIAGLMGWANKARVADVEEQGDEITVTVTGTGVTNGTLSYTVQVGDDLAKILAGLKTSADTAAAGFSVEVVEGKLVITSADVADSSFSANVAVVDVSVNTTEFGTVSSTAGSAAVEAVKQVSTVTLSENGALDVGDEITVTIAESGSTFNRVVEAGDTLDSVINLLASNINESQGLVTASNVDGVLTLTAKTAGTPFTVSSALNNVAVNDSAAALLGSGGTANVEGKGATAQVSTVTLDNGALDAGDVITVGLTDVKGDPFDVVYTVKVGDTLETVLAHFASQIDLKSTASGVTAQVLEGKLVLTETDAADTGFTVTSSVEDVNENADSTAVAATPTAAATATAQQSTVTFSGSFDQGDLATITVAGNEYTYSVQLGDDADAVVAGLQAAITADTAAVVIPVQSATGVLTLTAKDAAAGGFTLSSAVTDIVTAANSATSTMTQAATGDVTAVSQVSTLTFGTGKDSETTVAAGQKYTVIINDAVDSTYEYTAVNGASMITVLNALRSRINADTDNTGVTAVRSGTQLILSEKVAGTASFNVRASKDGKEISNAVKTPTDSVAGSEAKVEITSIDFAVAKNTDDSVASYDVGDSITLNINGSSYSTTLTEVLTPEQLVVHLVANATAAGFSLAAEAGTLVITGDAVNDQLNVGLTINNVEVTAATAPVVDTPVANVAEDAAQVTEVTLTGDFDAGDMVNVTIGETLFSYTVQVGEGAAAVLAGLVEKVNADMTLGVTAAEQDGKLTLTATQTGVEFVVDSSVTQVAVAGGNVSAVVTTANADATTAVAQIDTVTLSGTFDAGDKVQVKIGETTYEVVTTKAQTPTSIVEALVTQINDSQSVLTASNVDGVLTLTAKEAGTGFTVTSEVVQVQATEGSATAATPTENVVAADAVAQVDQIPLTGTFDAGDVVTVNIDETAFSYTVKVGDTVDTVGAGLLAAINDSETLAANAQASYSNGSNMLILTAKTPGTPFNVTTDVAEVVVNSGAIKDLVNVDNVEADVAQVSIIKFAGENTIERGDTYSITIDENTFSYTTVGDEGWFDILSALGEAIDIAGLAIDWEVTASGNADDTAEDFSMSLTARNAGTAFTASVLTTNRPAGTENSAAEIVDTVDNVVAVTPEAQISTIELTGGTLDAGDVIELTINGQDYAYTVTGQEGDNSAIIEAFIAQKLSSIAPLTASNVAGKLQLTGNSNGSPFIIDTVRVNNIQLQDNAGQTQDDTATPNVEEIEAVAQQSAVTFDFAGGNEVGDTYRITLDVDAEGDADPITVEFVTVGDETLAEIAFALADELALKTQDVTVTLAESEPGLGFDQLLFTAANAGAAFTVVPEVINRAEGAHENIAPTVENLIDNVVPVDAVAQQSTLTFTGADYEAGDTYSITIDADASGVLEPFTVTVVSTADEKLTDIVSTLGDELEQKGADLTVTLQESVTGSGVFDQLLITANNAGTAFTVSSEVVNRAAGANDDNDAVVEVTQGNVEEVIAQPQISFANFKENLVDGDTLYIALDIDGAEIQGQGGEFLFQAQLGAGGLTDLSGLLTDLQSQIEAEVSLSGYAAEVDGSQIIITGVADNAFSLEAGYNLMIG